MKNESVKSVSIRIPVSLLEELRFVSDYEGRSINSQVLYLIRQCISDFKEKHNS
ncbi:MAG: Arc family DNA-binding protein [Ruminococcaceae bacterium]|nr:Arc family DNA-binding protein [Oscillospiraceae bacterium]